jgi:DNA recombination protein RmuC
MVIVVGIIGVVLGGVTALLWSTKKGQGEREEAVRLRGVASASTTQIAMLSEMLERERTEHAASLSGLSELFENTASRALTGALNSLSQGQSQQVAERDSKLALTLAPLERLLSEYRKSLGDFNVENVAALETVKMRADQLLVAQGQTQEETRRLNQLLGRGDQRGHWGEVQLANVLGASGLIKGIDYDLQFSTITSEGRRLRPDAVVHAGASSIAIDAKFPFDSFEAGLASSTEEGRSAKYTEHAAAMRRHVKALGDKSYWEQIYPAPEFVVCFVPSDFAITTAFDGDPGLHEYAVRSRVLITGPTTLLSMLWSVAMVVANAKASFNAQEILRVGESMVERIRLVLEPFAVMGKHLEGTVDAYNKTVRSVESRLVPVARSMRSMGSGGSKGIPVLGQISDGPVVPNELRWGQRSPGLFDELDEGAIVEADVVEPLGLEIDEEL